VDELYEFFVERSFAQQPRYREVVMQNRLSDWLKDWNLRRLYKVNRPVGDQTFHVMLPFVHINERRITKALKPLDLDKAEPTEIYEHGDAWVQKMRRLRDRGAMPQEMVFTVQWPNQRRDVADEIAEDLRKLGVTVLPFERSDSLRERLTIS
jgi:hypothetical protein